jgi:hypothetical protein
MEFVNIVIPKVIIFVNVNLYRPYWVPGLVKFGWPYNAQRRSPFGEIRRRDDRSRRHRWHYINALFSEAARHFQIQMYRLSSTKFYRRSVYPPWVTLTPNSIYTSWSSSCSALFEVCTKYLTVVQGTSRQLTIYFLIKYCNVNFFNWFCMRPGLLGSQSTGWDETKLKLYSLI